MCAGLLGAQENTIVSAMKKEVERNKTGLKIDKLRSPFFISYTVIDAEHMNVSATLGSLSRSMSFRNRGGIPFLLVGDYKRNNINFGRNYFYPRNVSIDDSPEGIANSIWSDLDGIYKTAAENYEAKLAAVAQQNIDKEDLDLPDFDSIVPKTLILEPAKMNLDKNYWEDYAKKSSAVLKKYPDILRSSVDIVIRNATSYFYSTEKTEFVVPAPYYQIHLNLFAMTDDGHELNRDLYFEHTTFEQMPSLSAFTDTCEVLARKLLDLRKAPLLDDAYSGPVMFEGQAVPEAFQSQISRLFVARKPLTENGGNNTEMMQNKKLISRSFTVKSLSGTEFYKGKRLDGYYPIDAEGVVPDKELVLIENGVLKNMLNGRTPSKKFPHGNGHRRMNFSFYQSNIMPGNILLSSNQTFEPSEMKRKLLDAAKEEDLDYAYIVRGFRGQPFEIYRVHVADGREELVRGAVLQDLNLKSFKRVLGASSREYFYNTTAFGTIVTYIVPESILFEELEITRDNNIKLKTPFIVPRPE